MPQVQVIGTRIVALSEPMVEPPCPRGADECEGIMRRTDSVKTVTVQLNDAWEQLRCDRCGQHRWFRSFRAYALLPEDLEGV